jgi:N-acetylmuramoyl-L-alanine amidase
VVRTNDGNGVNVRASNSAQSAKVAGLAEGARVIVQGGDRSGAWLEITASNNVRGWVAAQFLQPAGQSTASAPQYSANTLYVKTLDGNGVNLRAEPSLNGRIVTTLKDRTAVTFRESVGQWSYVTTSNGMVGYIASSYLVGP